jgi:endonuclease VIII
MEGPSLVILKEELKPFVGKRVKKASGSSLYRLGPIQRHLFKKVESWGKHLLLHFDNEILKVHFLLFGSYRINDPKPNYTPRLQLIYDKGELDLYSCSIQVLDRDSYKEYDWSKDIMSKKWSSPQAVRAVKEHGKEMVCDVLLDQNIFAGVGNIIKNEVLYLERIHPEAKVSELSAAQIKALVKRTRSYSLQFYRWKKKFELKRHWQVMRKRHCPNCQRRLEIKHTGKRVRKSFFCSYCQPLPH